MILMQLMRGCVRYRRISLLKTEYYFRRNEALFWFVYFLSFETILFASHYHRLFQPPKAAKPVAVRLFASPAMSG
jgi:hypothetical protein